MVPISAVIMALHRFSNPAAIQTIKISEAEPSRAAISAGRMNIPEPMTPPITIEVAVERLILRRRIFFSVGIIEMGGNKAVKMMNALLARHRVSSLLIKPRADSFLHILNYFFIFHFHFIQIAAGTTVVFFLFPHKAQKRNPSLFGSQRVHDVD